MMQVDKRSVQERDILRFNELPTVGNLCKYKKHSEKTFCVNVQHKAVEEIHKQSKMKMMH